MLQEIQQNTTPSLTIGQHAIIVKSFTSDKLLTNKVLRFNPATYLAAIPVNGVAYQIIYPAAAGDYELDNLGCKNYKAFIEVIDGFNFKIKYHFFVSKDFNGYFPNNSYQNSDAFNSSGLIAVNLTFHVKIGNDEVTSNNVIDINGFCEDGMYFENDSFTPGEDLLIEFSTSGTVSNNFFVGLIKLDAISESADIVPGLVMNYAKIGSGVSQVDDLPYLCLKNGSGFIQYGSDSIGSVLIDGQCITDGSSFKIYVVYFKNGDWKSCISNEINQGYLKKPITPKFTYNTTDSFGNTIDKNCITGIANGIPLDICLTLDLADLNTQLNDAGYTGAYSDYLDYVKAFESDSISSNGLPLPLDNNDPTYCTNGYTTEDGAKYVIFQFVFNYGTHRDIVNVPFELIYDAARVGVSFEINDENGIVSELCDGGNYTHNNDFSNCEILQSIDGGKYTDSNIISGQDINEGEMPIDSKVCIKAICQGTVDTKDCECPKCGDMQYTAIGDFDENTNDSTFDFESEQGSILTVNGNTNNTNTWNTGGQGTQPLSYTIKIEKNGCTWLDSGILQKEDGEEDQNGLIVIEQNKIIQGVGTIDCDCTDTNIDCNNSANFNIDCDEDTETVTIAVVKNITATIESEETLCSFDGGQTFVNCPNTITGEQNIFVTYDAVLEDCENLHIEQVIKCVKPSVCQNTREIELENVNDELIITLTDNFNSTVISDVLNVSIDGGVTFVEYDPTNSYTPISLNGDESIIVYSDVLFEDGCNDLKTTATLDLINDPNPTQCIGYGSYDLMGSYDEATGEFTVTKTGNENDLIVNQLLWTIGGSNPFDNNNSGTPYYGAVPGEGTFIARWKIKLPNCEEKILTVTLFGKKCIEICEMPPVEVVFPETPIEICIVECCDGMDLTITCIDKTLHVEDVTGIPDSDIAWTGPNGFTATGNDVPITDEGLYIVSITDNSQDPPCKSTANYEFIEPNAGTPIDDPIIVS